MKSVEDKTIIFFVMSLSQPRCIKRVLSFHDRGYNCIVYGYRRGVYDVNEFPDGIVVNVLADVKNRDYLNNFKQVRQDVSTIVKRHGRNTTYYAFGFAPSLFFALKGTRFIYECSDVWYAYPRFNKTRWMFRFVDKLLIKKSIVTVMTSGGFAMYFDAQDSDKVVLLPNRVSPKLIKTERLEIQAVESISFGFVGSIRYKNVFRFAEVIGKYFPNYSFHFFGGGDQRTMELVQMLSDKYENVRYHGKFKSPDDLPSIYRELSVVVACYDNASLNEKIAEPNKLYESMYFCRPIVVSPNTYLASRVEEIGCGYVVDANSEASVKSFINSIYPEQIRKISSIERSIQLDEIVDNPVPLFNKLKSIANR